MSATQDTPPGIEDYIRINKAAEFLGVHRTTIYKWIKAEGWTKYSRGKNTYLDKREIIPTPVNE